MKKFLIFFLILGGCTECFSQGDRREFNDLLKRAQAGEPRAMGLVAFAYLEGSGTGKNIQKGVEWKLKAAEAGDLLSMYWVGSEYADGVGSGAYKGQKKPFLPQDVEKGVYWLKKAASQGYPNAYMTLGLLYLGTHKGTPRDLKQARFFLQKAVENGVPEAQEFLGHVDELEAKN